LKVIPTLIQEILYSLEYIYELARTFSVFIEISLDFEERILALQKLPNRFRKYKSEFN
jgi:hypothetical protein